MSPQAPREAGSAQSVREGAIRPSWLMAGGDAHSSSSERPPQGTRRYCAATFWSVAQTLLQKCGQPQFCGLTVSRQPPAGHAAAAQTRRVQTQAASEPRPGLPPGPPTLSSSLCHRAPVSPRPFPQTPGSLKARTTSSSSWSSRNPPRPRAWRCRSVNLVTETPSKFPSLSRDGPGGSGSRRRGRRATGDTRLRLLGQEKPLSSPHAYPGTSPPFTQHRRKRKRRAPVTWPAGRKGRWEAQP